MILSCTLKDLFSWLTARRSVIGLNPNYLVVPLYLAFLKIIMIILAFNLCRTKVNSLRKSRGVLLDLEFYDIDLLEHSFVETKRP